MLEWNWRPTGQGTRAVKHATDAALDTIDDLLQIIRRKPGLREKSRGIFYRRSNAFLHFHEDATGIYADVRGSQDFERFQVDSPTGRAACLKRIDELLTE